MDVIMLCADRESLAHPTVLGLDDVDLAAIPWIVAASEAQEARTASHAENLREIWIVSCDDMEAVNLAAAMRRDRQDVPILLVLAEVSGSACSRAQAAGVTATLTPQGFVERFAIEKMRYAQADEVAERLIMDLDIACARHAAEYASDADPISDADIEEPPKQGFAVTAHEADAEGPIAAASCDETPSARSAQPLRSAPFDEAYAGLPEKIVPLRGVASKPGARTRRPDAPPAFVMTVLSGSGGAGKSTVSVVCAECAAAKGYATVLVDCDMQFGDVARLAGVEGALTLDDAMADAEVPEALAHEAAERGSVAVIAAPKRLEQAEALAAQLPAFLDELAARFDVVVANTGASWAEYHAALIERSSCALFLIDQRASSVRACQHAIDLCMRLGVATRPFVYAVNRCERGALFTSIDVGCAMQGAHVFELRDGGDAVEELLGAGLACELMASKNELCASVSSMLDELLPERGTWRAPRAPKRNDPRSVHAAGGDGKRGRRRGKKRPSGAAGMAGMVGMAGAAERAGAPIGVAACGKRRLP